MIVYVLLLRLMAFACAAGAVFTVVLADWVGALTLSALTFISLGVAAGLESVAQTEQRLETLIITLRKRKVEKKNLAPDAPTGWRDIKPHPIANADHARILARRDRRLTIEEADRLIDELERAKRSAR